MESGEFLRNGKVGNMGNIGNVEKRKSGKAFHLADNCLYSICQFISDFYSLTSIQNPTTIDKIHSDKKILQYFFFSFWCQLLLYLLFCCFARLSKLKLCSNFHSMLGNCNFHFCNEFEETENRFFSTFPVKNMSHELSILHTNTHTL